MRACSFCFIFPYLENNAESRNGRTGIRCKDEMREWVLRFFFWQWDLIANGHSTKHNECILEPPAVLLMR